jgi:hypothetical protein
MNQLIDILKLDKIAFSAAAALKRLGDRLHYFALTQEQRDAVDSFVIHNKQATQVGKRSLSIFDNEIRKDAA